MGMGLRPYQEEARQAVWREWDGGNLKTLLVMVTGCGKTIVFSKITEDCVKRGERVLILAHRGELLQQAADKLIKSVGLMASVEKAEQTSLDSWYRVTVGSVQTLERDSRLQQFAPDYFDVIIVDEAHHCLSAGYQKVLSYFSSARVLGVTATPDRGDMRNLGQFFQSLAYEYTLLRAINEGYLCPIKAQTIPISIDMTSVRTQSGDYQLSDVGNALDPYLEAIAKEMVTACKGRKTVVFLPLIQTSKKMSGYLNQYGFRSAEINGESENRAELLRAFDEGEYDVLCNSMLLTEGWDCPSVDCVVPLRPTKIRSLYCQMVGRGTRLHEGKKDLLIVDFLWATQKHDLIRPAHLVSKDQEVAEQMTKNLEESGEPENIEEAEQDAQTDVVRKREEALAAQLKEMRHRKRALVDPLQYEMSIQAEDLAGYVPSFGWEMAPASDAQKAKLEKLGIMPDEIECAGKASMLLDKLHKRIGEGLTTPKQIRFLENKGFQHVGTWKFEHAKKLIDRIAANHWTVPYTIRPSEYVPEKSGEAC